MVCLFLKSGHRFPRSTHLSLLTFTFYQQPEKASKKSIFTPLDIGGGRGGVDFAFIGKQMAVPARRNPSRPPLKPKGRSEA